jgi:Vam6/Vps39-like protein vacuolar protein sorting-associated protein 39
VYHPGTETEGIYLELLKLYLKPSVKTSADLLRPALDLIGRHSPRIDPVATLEMLPPLITAQDVRTFLMEALRAPIFDTRVKREVSKAREEQLSRRLMSLEARRVKITDTRMYVFNIFFFYRRFFVDQFVFLQMPAVS